MVGFSHNKIVVHGTEWHNLKHEEYLWPFLIQKLLLSETLYLGIENIVTLKKTDSQEHNNFFTRIKPFYHFLIICQVIGSILV